MTWKVLIQMPLQCHESLCLHNLLKQCDPDSNSLRKTLPRIPLNMLLITLNLCPLVKDTSAGGGEMLVTIYSIYAPHNLAYLSLSGFPSATFALKKTTPS